jgi:hypothetical protein
MSMNGVVHLHFHITNVSLRLVSMARDTDRARGGSARSR